MWEYFVLFVVVTSSALCYVLLRWRWGASGRELGAAVRCALELAGMMIAFLIANLALGIAFVFSVRTFTRTFVSVYLLNDAGLVGLSILQGLVVGCWRDRRVGAGG
jgi:hypothetical protein